MSTDHLDADEWISVDPTRLQRFLRALVTRPGRWWYRFSASGHEPRVPPEGGFLLCANHGSRLDPFVLGLGQERNRLRFMAKHQALSWPILGRLIRRGGGFPVVRGAGRSHAALDVARAVIEAGDGVVLFPEGTVRKGEEFATPRSGIARLALSTGAPVVPVGIHGLKQVRTITRFRIAVSRPRTTLVWGKPLQFARNEEPTSEQVEAALNEIWSAISECYRLAAARANSVEALADE